MARPKINNPKSIIKTLRITKKQNQELKKLINISDNLSEQKILLEGLNLYINNFKKDLNFKKWLFLKFKDENGIYDPSPFGDLTSDVYNDSNFPNSDNKTIIKNYLISKFACIEAIETFEESFKSYIAFKKRFGG